jgi:hypothetical protein
MAELAARGVGQLNWCHTCGKWSSVRQPTYMCADCVEEWIAVRNNADGEHDEQLNYVSAILLPY